MVGVPGKYKGCETCRRRRVKCSNERPFCKNCIGSGRTCEGYEREMVFITGTPATKGRVASHPKKTTPSRRSKASNSASPSPSIKTDELEKPQMLPLPPLTSAWDDYARLSNQGAEFPALVTALQTNLQSITRQGVDGDEDHLGAAAGHFGIHFPPYSTSELHPNANDAFGMNAQCIVCQKPANDEHGSSESYCAFLFEYDSSSASWRLTAEQMGRLGPRHFASFPNHYFFVRVYRPLALSLALLSRRDTFLSTPQWTTIPWEQHPKSLFDQLFDIAFQLPSLFALTDQLILLQPTLTRRVQAQDLLHHCLVLERQFGEWLREACKATPEFPYPFWAEELRSHGGAMPFTDAYTFKDGLTGLMFLYYWMAMIPFHRCIETLHMTIFQPVVEEYPNIWPNLPPSLQIDPAQYQDGRELASNICRGLDSALDGTVQPDMILAPMTVAMDFYRDLNTMSQDGVLEILWLEGFKKRLGAKGQAVGNVLLAHKWTEIAKF